MQATFIRNVGIDMSAGGDIGIWMENGSGGFMSDISVVGGNIGLQVRDTSGTGMCGGSVVLHLMLMLSMVPRFWLVHRAVYRRRLSFNDSG